ncbi:cation:proton antiporter [Streptomyces sp. NPDC050844]|uniref:cation:proton antiporter domain-containing protein n=1 Tax=Streptomyces sp. NPDC050844 TaxID=3155790 RepID=UPI0033F1DDB3
MLSTVLGLAVGGIGGIGGWLVRWSRGRGLATRGWQQVFVLAVAAGSYTLAVVVDGRGSSRPGWPASPSVSACGRASRRMRRPSTRTPPTLRSNWRIITYAVLSLTVVRMLPVALSLAGSRLALPTVAYIGWFGPRGLASIVFGLLVVEEHVPGVQLLGQVVAVTVALSILLHGVSAVVLTERYGDWHKKAAARRPQPREGMPDEKAAGSASTTR